ncbi:CGNR zinc finger domain-containing protein [Isoptericola sp. G70]|uniref:CGNR zinc finger domain-containing protein n=1 Tax=Isoptericola sp. G70 TaxID=3376633 RepID=UPI003A8032E2
MFVSGNPALDLTGTVLRRHDDPVDLLTTPADLVRWTARCDEVPTVDVDADAFTDALSLREAVYRLAQDHCHDRPFDRRSLDVVNTVAAGPTPSITLDDEGVHRAGDVRAVLSFIARRGMVVLADRSARIKECGREGCTRLYLDRSRGARRTWCGMAACGNRVNAAAYRARRRS